MQLTFKPVDLAADGTVCIAYMRDLLRLNFGSDEPFVRDYGADGAGYIQWLRPRLAENPQAAVIACANSQQVGMVVVGRWRADPSIGYISQYYLIPEWRGHGLGRQLDQYALRQLWQRGFRRARLTASATNESAVRFYTKLGWLDAGARPDVPGTIYFTREIPAPAATAVD